MNNLELEFYVKRISLRQPFVCKGIHLKLNTILGEISEHFHSVVLELPLWVLKVWHTAWFSFLWTTYSWQLQDIYRQLYLLNIFSYFFHILHLIFTFILVANSWLISSQLNWKLSLFQSNSKRTDKSKYQILLYEYTLYIASDVFLFLMIKSGRRKQQEQEMKLA